MMQLTKELVTCPMCIGSFFGAVSKTDKQAHDVICPRCRTRFSVDGFLGRTSSILATQPIRRQGVN